MNDYKEYEQLQENPKFEEIVKDLTDGLGVWQRPKPSATPTLIETTCQKRSGMVLFHQLRCHPFKARLHSETRPCHTFVCIGLGV